MNGLRAHTPSRLASLGAALASVLLLAGACSFIQGPEESTLVDEAVPAQLEESADGNDEAEAEPSPAELAATDESQPADLSRDFSIALVKPESWVPGEVSIVDQSTVIMTDLLYDGLTEAAGTSSQLRPALALDWTANADLTEWTFTLDTTRVDATDVALDFTNKLNSGTFASSVLLAGVVEIKVLGPDQLLLRSETPNAGLPWRLSGVGASIIGRDGATTGPFTVVSDTASDARLEPAAWVTTTEMAIDVHWTESDSDSYERLTLGAVEAAVIGEADIDESIDRFGSTYPARNVSSFVVLNSRSQAMETEGARRAIGAAIDRDLLAATYGVGTYAADGVSAPSMAGFRPGTCSQACQYDPESVAELVDSAAVGPLVVGYTGDELASGALIIVSALATVDINSEAVAFEPAALSSGLADGSIDIALSGWVAPASSLDGVVPALFSADGGLNLSGVFDEAVQDLVAEAAEAESDSQRWGLLAQAERLAVEAGAVLPIGLDKSLLAIVPGGPNLPVRADGSIDLGGFR